MKKIAKPCFDRTPTNHSLLERAIAYGIDWLLGGIFMMLPLCVVWIQQTEGTTIDGVVNVWILAELTTPGFTVLMGGISLLFALLYYVGIPWKLYPGQTLGKHMMRLQIVTIENQQLSLKTLIIRQVLGIFILEGMLYNAGSFLQNMLSFLCSFPISIFCMPCNLFITLCSIYLCFRYPSRRMLHDYLAGTKVIGLHHL